MIHVYRGYNRYNKRVPMMLICLVSAFLILLSFYILFSFISYTNSSIKQAEFAYKRITVQKGDTLWGLTAKVNDSMDTAHLINKTIKYNHLSSTYIQPGQVIYIPVRL